LFIARRLEPGSDAAAVWKELLQTPPDGWFTNTASDSTRKLWQCFKVEQATPFLA